MGGLAAAMSALRKETGKSQKQVADDLGVSQALLSHYENGAREPKLAFVSKACDYYGVTADYMLGRSSERIEAAIALRSALNDTLSELQKMKPAYDAVVDKLKNAL